MASWDMYIWLGFSHKAYKLIIREQGVDSLDYPKYATPDHKMMAGCYTCHQTRRSSFQKIDTQTTQEIDNQRVYDVLDQI